MVSALEPLVEQLPYSEVAESQEIAHEVDKVLEDMKDAVGRSELPEIQKSRWKSQIGDYLGRESISLALRRMVEDRVSDNEVLRSIEEARGIEMSHVLSEAYNVRSRILHGADNVEIDHQFKKDTRDSIEAVLGASVDAETFHRHRRIARSPRLPTLP